MDEKETDANYFLICFFFLKNLPEMEKYSYGKFPET